MNFIFKNIKFILFTGIFSCLLILNNSCQTFDELQSDYLLQRDTIETLTNRVNTLTQELIEQNIKQGAILFQNVFGFKSESIIAPNYHWHPKLENTFNDIGVQYIQGTRFQNFYDNKRRKRFYLKIC